MAAWVKRVDGAGWGAGVGCAAGLVVVPGAARDMVNGGFGSVRRTVFFFFRLVRPVYLLLPSLGSSSMLSWYLSSPMLMFR